MGCLKSICTTSYRSSIDTIALSCLVFGKIALLLHFGNRQTDRQTNKMNSTDALSRVASGGLIKQVRVKGQEKLNTHIIFESMLMLFTQNYRSHFMLVEITACQSWRFLLRHSVVVEQSTASNLVCSGQLSLLSLVKWEMSSSWRPNVADGGSGMSASCTTGSTVSQSGQRMAAFWSHCSRLPLAHTSEMIKYGWSPLTKCGNSIILSFSQTIYLLFPHLSSICRTLPVWCSGSTLVLINVRSYSTLGSVSAQMCDGLWTSKPRRRRTRHWGLLILSPPSVGRLE